MRGQGQHGLLRLGLGGGPAQEGCGVSTGRQVVRLRRADGHHPRRCQVSAALSVAASLRPLAEQVSELERQAIAAVMSATKGNKVAAAKMLGISRAKLYERLLGMSEN